MRTLKGIRKPYYITNMANGTIFITNGEGKYDICYGLVSNRWYSYYRYSFDMGNREGLVRTFLTKKQVDMIIEYHSGRGRVVFDIEWIRGIL